MALSTNKSRSKAVMGSGGTPVPRGELLHAGDMPTLTTPFIVKPCSEDNSMGVTLVRSAEETDAALAEAFKFDDEVLVEEYLPLGREVRGFRSSGCLVVSSKGSTERAPLTQQTHLALSPLATPRAIVLSFLWLGLRSPLRVHPHAWLAFSCVWVPS